MMFLTTSIQLMGKTYQIKCQEEDADALKRAAGYLNERMCEVRDIDSVIGIDRIAIITALNLAQKIMCLEDKNYTTHQRLVDLQHKIDDALAPHPQMELASAE